MNYQETLNYLYDCAPMFQNVGGAAYKEGLTTTKLLDKHLGHPHRSFRTIHVAGTNGKGSCSHTLAAILQSSGLYRKVGLYTSPHMTDFRERFRINGKPMPQDYVIDFVARERSFFEPLSPSFFELTTAMGFRYFADEGVDIAVIEVGLGGRLDCTNIITPILSIITNISMDHTAFLGDTLAAIASEKAGIIKEGVPVLVGEGNSTINPVFQAQASAKKAPITFANDESLLQPIAGKNNQGAYYETTDYGTIVADLEGSYQYHNLNTVLHAIRLLRTLGITISDAAVVYGLGHVCSLTHLRGRWQKLNSSPTVICDTGHNVAGLTYVVNQLKRVRENYEHLHIVFGMVDDKDWQSVLKLLPHEATYYFTQAQTHRAVPVTTISQYALALGLCGTCYENVAQAYAAAISQARTKDMIFIGGSSYVVADLFLSLK